jgi:hypothetical protein
MSKSKKEDHHLRLWEKDRDNAKGEKKYETEARGNVCVDHILTSDLENERDLVNDYNTHPCILRIIVAL